MQKRCEWAEKSEIMRAYHDEEWGKPLHDDQKLFEFLILEGMQAGLSWYIILRKRDAFRKAYENFDVKKVAAFDQNKVEELVSNTGIIRNKAKIGASINNAKCFLEIVKEFESFDQYIWSFVGGKPIVNRIDNSSEMPAKTELSDKISDDLKKRGFKFVGSTVVYAHIQATGMVNDHYTYCFCHPEYNGL